MRVQSLLLLVALLALGSWLPSASGRKKGEKSGGCPPDDGPCLSSVPDQCIEDSQCPSTMKCCYRACFRQCVPRVSVKSGRCPEDHLHCLSPMNHLCHQDVDCSGKKRCCLSACGRDCRDPARGLWIEAKLYLSEEDTRFLGAFNLFHEKSLPRSHGSPQRRHTEAELS
ncbi:WAP four-disulfide core domain protein 5 [Carlito syrichta]|uniref:WAP four-disulfide core domain protein 5 n=1 Tax=Carlito syrichta TaxID=1868482 RepID=A0A1U7TYR2_CARSF|nr:WAP four-disulfide core domain protein 5 [Carlito syrichta]